MIERPYHVRLGDHANTIVRRDLDALEAEKVARRISRNAPNIRVHVVHRDIGILRSYEAGARVPRT